MGIQLTDKHRFAKYLQNSKFSYRKKAADTNGTVF